MYKKLEIVEKRKADPFYWAAIRESKHGNRGTHPSFI
jgi:hypothetical protein